MWNCERVADSVEAGNVFRGGPLGGQAGRSTGYRGVVVAEVTQLGEAQLVQPVADDLGGDLLLGPDEAAAAAAAPGVDQPAQPERGQRLADRGGGDAEDPGQVGLARELLRVGQQAERDRVGEPPGHQLGSAQ
jgi:hypothetical protein